MIYVKSLCAGPNDAGCARSDVYIHDWIQERLGPPNNYGTVRFPLLDTNDMRVASTTCNMIALLLVEIVKQPQVQK